MSSSRPTLTEKLSPGNGVVILKNLPSTGILLKGRCSEMAIWALPQDHDFGSLPYCSLKYSSARSNAILEDSAQVSTAGVFGMSHQGLLGFWRIEISGKR